MPRTLPALLLLTALTPAAASAQPTEEQVRLHGIGYAQLENEREVEAENTYRELIDLVPDEPLGHANLAVALLRQDRKDEALAAIDRALELGGNRADLRLIRADILQWSGRNEDALVDYRRAARAAPDDPETQYALFRHADIMSGPEAEADRRTAADRLRRLRPDNLVVLRTFSKSAGIAGLRLGYGIIPEWFMPYLWSFKQPYNVNVAATVAGLASLRYADQMTAIVQKIRAERDRLQSALQDVPYLSPYPSNANFVLCSVEGFRSREDGDAAALKLALEERGILVRYYQKPGLQHCIRISVGRPDQTDRLLEELHRLS